MANLADLRIGVEVDDSGARNGFDKVPQAADDAVDEVESTFKKMGPGLATAAKAAGVAAGAALVAGAVLGMEREAVGDKLGAQLNLSEAETAMAGDIAGRLYADNFGDSIGEVHDAVGAVASTLADLGTGEVEGLTEKALALADVFEQDIAESVSTVGVLLKTGLVNDATEAFDLMTAGLQEMPTGLRDELGEATTEYSKFFADLGFSGEEMFALFAQADDRFALDKTGDALKELSIRATDMSSASVEAYEAAGLNADEMAAKVLAGGEIARSGFGEIVDGLLSIEDPTARANAAIGLFGTPIEDLGTAEIPAFLDSLRNLGDGLGDTAGRAEGLNDAYDNAASKVESAKRGVEGFLASVVEAPGALGDAATAAAGVGAAIQPVAPMLTGVGIVFQDQIGSMVSAMASGTAGAARWAAGMAVSGTKAVASMAVTSARFVAHYAAMAAAAAINAAKMAASWVIAMGPVGWVIAAVVALVALIVANWDTVKEWTGKAWDWISDKVASAWEWVTEKTSAAVDAIVGFFVRLWQGAQSKVQVLIEWVQSLPGRLLRALGNLGRMLFDAGKAILQGLWDGMKRIWDNVTGWVGGLGNKIRNLKGPIEKDRKLLTGEGNAIMEGLGSGLTSGWADNERLLASMAGQMHGVFDGLGVPKVSGLDVTARGSDGQSMGGVVFEAGSVTIHNPRPEPASRFTNDVLEEIYLAGM